MEKGFKVKSGTEVRMYMRQMRAYRHASIEQMARKSRISSGLMGLIEGDDTAITHPAIAQRIGMAYGMGREYWYALTHRKHWKDGAWDEKLLEMREEERRAAEREAAEKARLDAMSAAERKADFVEKQAEKRETLKRGQAALSEEERQANRDKWRRQWRERRERRKAQQEAEPKKAKQTDEERHQKKLERNRARYAREMADPELRALKNAKKRAWEAKRKETDSPEKQAAERARKTAYCRRRWEGMSEERKRTEREKRNARARARYARIGAERTHDTV